MALTSSGPGRPQLTTRTESVAANVRAEIARQGRKVQDIAGEVGLSPAGLSRRLNGHTAFKLDELDELARALGVGLYVLLRSAA